MNYAKGTIQEALTGTGVALVTPFNKDLSIDFGSLGKLIDHVIEGGVEYVVSMGTTGESATLSEAERFECIRFTVKHVSGRVPVVAGFGGNNTTSLIESIGRFDFQGVTALLSASPYYNKPTQEGIYAHYMAIDRTSPVPVILYNVPGRTASNVTADTTLRLASDGKHIVAVKEASGDLGQMMGIYSGKNNDFLLLSGDDAITLPIISIGGQGVISVIANAYPRQFSEMVRMCLKGDYEEARKLHYPLIGITNAIFREGNPAGVKAVLQLMGIMNDEVRLPLAGISNGLREDIRGLMKLV